MRISDWSSDVCSSDLAELDQAVAAARAAFKTWKNTPVEARRAALQAMAKAIKDNHEELYRLLTSEQGKPHEQARGEIMGSAYMTATQATLELEDVISEDSEQRLCRTRRVPVGVVGRSEEHTSELQS